MAAPTQRRRSRRRPWPPCQRTAGLEGPGLEGPGLGELEYPGAGTYDQPLGNVQALALVALGAGAASCSPVSVATRVSRSSGTLIARSRFGDGGPDHGRQLAPRAELAEKAVTVPLASPHDRGQRLDALAPAHGAAQLGGQQRLPFSHVGVGEGVHVGHHRDGQREKRRTFQRFSQVAVERAP